MKRFITLFFALLPTFGFCQYVPQFSQIINTLEFINPGYNASKDIASVVMLHRNQWTGFTGSPKTFAFNANVPINKWHTGFGINSLVETRGLFTQTNVDVTACVDVKATPTSYLAFGLWGGIESKKIELERAIWFGDQLFSANDYNNNNMHVGIGLNLFTPKMHLGASMHYTPHEQTYYNENELFSVYLNGSYLFPVNDNWTLKPSALFSNYGGYSQFEYGAFFLFKDVAWLGISNRLNQALIFFADYKITGFIRVGYSYDLGIRSNSDFNYGSHEIRIELTAPRKNRKFERMASL